jgi:hypothetical protein
MTAVVLASGCISPCGYGADALVRARRANWRPGHHGKIDDFDARAYLEMRGLRSLSRATLLAAVAADAALASAADAAGNPEREGVVLGTRWASLEPLFDFERTAARDGPGLVNPAHFPNVVVNSHAGYLGILFRRAGPNVTVCGAAAGLEAIGQALDLLLLDRSDGVLAGGVEALGGPVLLGLEATAADGAEEGAALLLLAREGGRARGAARVAAYEAGPPSADGLAEAALERAGVAPDEVAAYWFTGAAPASMAGTIGEAEVFEGVSGAAGALAVAAATETVRERGAPAVAGSFPADGTQAAVVIAPL